ncbi:hypothetical protein [uncultured Mediterranean phage uvDeep-CGR2-KM21-C338]|nr:hypothetical protein [uncultured Mediterranean phage uvDeep-CGR2-KM21-C338]
MAPDLGDLHIFEEPLVIHGVKAGGRRLTKALFWQLPDYRSLSGHYGHPAEDPGSVRAWVNIHWRDCIRHGRFIYMKGVLRYGGEHRHVICTDDMGRIFRGEVMEPAKATVDQRIDLIGDQDEANAYALFWGGAQYRWSNTPDRRVFKYHFEIEGMEYNLDADGDYGPYIRTDTGGATWKDVGILEQALKKNQDLRRHWPADPETAKAYLAAIGERVRAWRYEANELWRVVTTEVPQVFI